MMRICLFNHPIFGSNYFQVSQILQKITAVVDQHMLMLNKYKQLFPEIITGKKLPLLYTEIFSDQNNNTPQGGVIQTPQEPPLAQSTPPKPTAVKSNLPVVSSVNQQPESPISSRDSLNTSGSNHEQLSSSSSPTGNLKKNQLIKANSIFQPICYHQTP